MLNRVNRFWSSPDLYSWEFKDLKTNFLKLKYNKNMIKPLLNLMLPKHLQTTKNVSS